MEERKLNGYLDEIGRQSLLSAADEQQLAARVAQGDARALNRLVEANLRLVVAVAGKYQHRGLSMDDLVSEGNMGLLRAARKFDATRGVRFAAYAVGSVRREIERALLREGADRRVEATRSGSARSVDAPLGSKANVSLLSVLPDTGSPLTDQRLNMFADEEQVARALTCLNDRERRVVAAFYGIGQDHLTMAEIALDMGLKRERVRQIRDRAVRRMRKIK